MSTKKRLMGILCFVAVLFAVPITASAYSFSLSIPDYFVGSMQSTALYTKTTSTTTPYVDPSINTLPTAYFLSPARISSVTATDVITISNGSKQYFTWKEGYGGILIKYCLSAYPNMIGDWDGYDVRGTWSN